MRKNKFIIYLFLFISVIFLSLNHVEAIPSSLGPIDQVGSKVIDSDCPSPSGSCYSMALKINQQNGSIATICTNFMKRTPAAGNKTCTITNDWDEKTRYAVAAIINKANPGISVTGMTNEYFSAELAINEFLYQKKAGGHHIYKTSLNSKYRTLFDSYYQAAFDAYDSYDSDSKVTLNLSKSNLTFTLEGSNYVSKPISVSGVSKYSVVSNIGTTSKTSDGFIVSVPASSINQVTTINVKISSSKTLDQARNYDCGTYTDTVDYDNDGNTTETLKYQTITPNVLDSVTKSNSKTISGTITPLGKLTINKYDGNNKHLAGATIKVTGTKGYSKTFKTEGKAIVIENLEYDTYTIEETEVPSGYIKEEKKTVTLSSTSYSSTINLVNKKIKTSFSKLDVIGKEELPGAFLEIQDEEGNVVKLCTGSDGKNNVECSWISTNEPRIIEGLPIGKYYLVETIAPDKYVLSKEKVAFEITGKEENVKVEMKNALNKVKISKISLVDKKELPGATLEIQDKEGKVVEFCTDANGKKNKPCMWVSSDEPYEIEGMPNGTYYLVETMAPEGFVLSKEKIEFTIDGNEAIVEVEMGNELEVKVPDTLSSRSVLLIAISMFDIALGIGILTYVKKNKVQE